MGIQDDYSVIHNILFEFSTVFAEELRECKGPLVSLVLDLTVAPIWMKLCHVPFEIKVHAEFHCLIKKGTLEPVTYSTRETPIVTPMKASDICFSPSDRDSHIV